MKGHIEMVQMVLQVECKIGNGIYAACAVWYPERKQMTLCTNAPTDETTSERLQGNSEV